MRIVNRFTLFLLGLAAAVSVGIYAQTSTGVTGTGVTGGGSAPGGSLYATQYNNGTTLGGAGPGTSGQILTSNGAGSAPTFQAAAAGVSGANPTASVGLTAVNGSAATFLRSDGAPALDQTIAPTWTGSHIYSKTYSSQGVAPIQINSSIPGIEFDDSAGGANGKYWGFYAQTAVLHYSVISDAGSYTDWLNVARTGTTVNTISFSLGGVATAYNFQGTGTSTFSGNVQVNGVLKSAGTKFTASGCSNSTTVGGAIAGSYNSGTTGTCTVVITLPASTTGWRCNADDITTPADLQHQTATTTTSCTISGTTVSGDTIVWSAMGY